MSVQDGGSKLLAVAVAALWLASWPGQAQAQPPGFGAVEALDVRAVAQKSVARPGDPLVIAVELAHRPGFHTWPNAPVVPPEFGADFPAIATTIDVTGMPDGSVVQPVQWPDPVPVTVYYTMEPVELLSYTGTMVAFVPLTLPPDAPLGDTTVDLTVGYQACDETNCYPPTDVPLSVPLRIAAADAGADGAQNEPELFAGFDLGAFAGGAAVERPAERLDMSAFGWQFSIDPGGATGMALLLLLAALGGLLLNFTPCVLPVLPLKVMGLSRAAGNPRRLFLLGVMMSLGVVAFWLLLGGAIAYVSGFSAISSLFQTGWFALVVGVVVAVMAVGMFGVFEVTLPQAVYRVRPDQETLHGSFLFGVLAAILATPCTAPFMGAAAAWAATREPAVTMATFAAIGIGMAAPYLALTARPSLLSSVPRSGPASVLLKQVMGLLMLAVATFFIGLSLASILQTPPDPPSRAYWWLVGFWVLAACVWAVVRTFRITSAPGTRAAVTVTAALGALLTVVLIRDLTGHGPIAWTYYTPERFESARAEGSVLVLDFTAEWCLNCRALESGVLNQPAVAEALAKPGVVPMRVDLTGDNPDGKAKLSELGWVGIPLLAVFGPGTGYEEPQKYDTYTQQVVIDAVDRARGGP
jgi:thiol:disulfide interchange protein DsbD